MMIGQPIPPTGADNPTGMSDTNVAKLPHYMAQKIQPIRFMQASLSADEFTGFLKGNIIKYVMRERNKNGVEDIQKAQVYMNWLVEYSTTGDITVPGERK